MHFGLVKIKVASRNLVSLERSSFFLPFFVFVFLGLRLWHIEVARLGVKSEVQLWAYTTATVTWDP